MEKTLESFRQRQENTLKILEDLSSFLDEGETYGIDIDVNVKKKLTDAIQNVRNEKLRVVLIGGFSEGKTAIAAAWLERLDKSSMNISHEESSNEIRVYDTNSDCVLVDTPGLFGFKEQFDSASGKIEKYKELTQRHVSEAHLILYVMDPVNPIKESHREELNWIFRELNLLSRTVFVLSRFDEVADIEDEEDYLHHFSIKKGNVVKRLSDLLSLSEAEVNELALVAVAADPFGEGTEYWLSHMERFRKLSHIGQLQRATSEKVANAGGVEQIANAARQSIARDVLGTQLPVAIQTFSAIDNEVEKLQSMQNRKNHELNIIQGRVKESRSGLRDFVSRFFADLILQAKGVSMETFSDFFERNIGSEGVMLNTKLQNEFEKRLGSVRFDVNKMAIDFETEVNHFNQTIREYGKQGVAWLAKSGINNTTVLVARDGIVGVAKFVGMDIGKFLKFKPWGAVKFAKGFGAAVAVLGFAFEAWDSWKEKEKENKFQDAIKQMVDNFEQQRKELLELIDSPTFEEQCLPQLVSLRSALNDIEKSVQTEQAKRDQFDQWRRRGEAIEGEFRRLAG